MLEMTDREELIDQIEMLRKKIHGGAVWIDYLDREEVRDLFFENGIEVGFNEALDEVLKLLKSK